MSNGDDAKFCGHCGSALVRREAYTRQSDQKQMSGSWRCPNWRFDGSGCEGTTVWDPKPRPPQQGQQQARQWAKDALPNPQAPTQGNGTRERSIEAQTAIKAACELVGRMYAGSVMSSTSAGIEHVERAATEMVIRVAKRLMREVVLVAPTLQPDYAPSAPNAFAFTEDNPPPPEDADIPF